MQLKTTYITLFILASLFPVCIKAQQTSPAQTGSSQLEDKIEEVSGSADADYDYSEFMDDLIQYLNHPVNINKASERELAQLQLNELQIVNLRAYIDRFGELSNLYELNLIEGFDSVLVANLSPYITFTMTQPGARLNLKNLTSYGKNQLITRYQQTLEEQKGYSAIDDSSLNANPNARYLGGPQKLYARYSYSFYNKLRFGVTMEKDAGEPFLPKSDTLKKGFDFYSFHLYYAGNGFFKQLALGDFHLQFGQGLTMCSSLAFGKSPSGIASRRIPQQIKPSTGTNENLFMRGIAATITPLRYTDITFYYSSNNADASLNDADSLNAEETLIRSLQETGYHRTPGELAAKKAINIESYGANIQTRIKMLRFGATATHTTLSKPLQLPPSLYSKFDFSGNQLSNLGIDYAVILKGLTFYGEAAASDNGGLAFITGATANPDPRLALSLVYRNYAKDYQNFYSNAFGEASRNANEKGLYAGWMVQLARRISFSGYADFFRFPWLKFRVDAPSNGKEYLTQLTWTPNRKTEIQFRYRYKQKQINVSENAGYTNYPENETRQNYRINLVFKANPWITLKSRAESVVWQMPGQNRKYGYLIYQDLNITAPEKPWTISTRYALFDTDTYDQRLYAYESDVLYAFSIPSYYYRGSRFYLLGKYSVGRTADLWVRYAITTYANKNVIGSGLDEINGNRKSEIKIQLRIRF